MKKWIILILIGSVFVACEELENGVDLGIDELGSLNLFEEYLVEENLVITRYIEDSVDKSGEFTNYSFIFSSVGSIDALFEGDTINGTWTVAKNDSIPKIIIDFGNAEEPLEQLNEDWIIVSESEDKIELKDISGVNGSIDYLTFEKE